MSTESAGGVTESKVHIPFWQNETVRVVIYQFLAILGIGAGGYWIVSNVIDNLKRLGISSGFDYLDRPAGFDIGITLIPYDMQSSNLQALLVSIANTLSVSGAAIVAATLLGFLLGVARLSPNWLLQKLASIYVETLRNVPLLLQIVFWYFGVLAPLPNVRQSLAIGDSVFLNVRGLYVPSLQTEDNFAYIWGAIGIAILSAFFLARWARRRQQATGQQFPIFLTNFAILLGLPILAYLLLGQPASLQYPALQGFDFRGGWVLRPEFVALFLALALYTAAFIAEIVRAGIMAVSQGQTEAAYALGLRPGRTTRLIIVPQALRVIVPPLTSQYLNIVKNSSLAIAIGYPEIVSVFAGTVLNQTGQAMESIAITMTFYLSISLLISFFMNWYNRRIALVER